MAGGVTADGGRPLWILLAVPAVAIGLVLAALLIVQADPEPEAAPRAITVSMADVNSLRARLQQLATAEQLREIAPYSLRTRVMMAPRRLLAVNRCEEARSAAEADGRISLLERWRVRRAC
jgi:hypothetical protein